MVFCGAIGLYYSFWLFEIFPTLLRINPIEKYEAKIAYSLAPCDERYDCCAIGGSWCLCILVNVVPRSRRGWRHDSVEPPWMGAGFFPLGAHLSIADNICNTHNILLLLFLYLAG